MSKSNDLFDIFQTIENEKGIPKDELISMISAGLQAAYRKYISDRNADVTVRINPEIGSIRIFLKKKVVEFVDNPAVEITEAEAAKVASSPDIGSVVNVEVSLDDFGRIAASTTRQIILQRIREKEREKNFTEMTEKKGDIVSGTVLRFVEGNAIVDIGKTEGILLVRDMIRTERLAPGDRIKSIVLNVTRTQRGTNVLLSRRDNLFVKKLFEQEVPEIQDKTIEIKDIVREPGYRSKVAVATDKKNIDPVGTCVGLKGMRIKAILEEIQGEKIDMVQYSDDTHLFIKNSLSPAKIVNVTLDKENKIANVMVGKEQLSIAIGSHGQNVRLASRLVGWHIELRTEDNLRDQEKKKEQKGKEESAAPAAAPAAETAPGIDGISAGVMEKLKTAGFDTRDKIKGMTAQDLVKLPGIGEKKAESLLKIIKKAKE